MKKKKTVSQLKKELDKLVSRFVRLSGQGICYTCGLKREKLELQCGHFISRAHSATRYDLDNLRTQCVNCNVWRRGNTAFFAANLLKEYGTERFDALIKRGRSFKQFTTRELEAEIKRYSQLVKELEKNMI